MGGGFHLILAHFAVLIYGTIIVFNPYDTRHIFYANATLMSVATNQTQNYIRMFTVTPENHIPSGESDSEAAVLGTLERVTLQKRRRFCYLEHLYHASGADSSRMFHWREVAASLGMSDDIAASACCYLRHKKLANGEAMTDGISQAGIDEYELAITKPDQPTEHFPQQVTINTGHSSNVMMSSPGAHQTLTTATAPADLQGTLDLIHEIRRALPSLELQTDLREDLEVMIVDLQAQVEQPDPDRRKVRAGLRSLGTLLESFSLSVTANALTVPILDQLHRLLPLFSH